MTPPLAQPATAADRLAVDAFFRDRPAARATFEALRAFMATVGRTQLAATRSRVSFVARTRFLWVHEAHLDGSVTVGFLLPHALGSPRVRSGPVGSRWSHHCKVRALDGELEAWLREAWEWDAAPLARMAKGRAGRP